MTQNDSKISICVPVYNRSDLTIRALRSVLQQTVKPFEVIVLDDNSTEDMKKVEEFCYANGFAYQKNIKNLGLINNINETILRAKGDFWCVLHNDDMLSPVYIEKCLDFLDKYPEFEIWATNGCAINSADDVIAEFRLFRKDATIKKGEGLKTLYRGGYYTLLSIIGSTIYRTSFIKRHLFDSSWGNEADLDNALYFLANYDIKYIDTAIYFTRMHDEQESKRLKETENKLVKYIHNRISIYKKYQDNFSKVNLLGPVYAVHILQLMIKYKYPINKVCQILNINILNFLNVIFIDMPIFIINQFRQKIDFSVNPSVLHDKNNKKFETPCNNKWPFNKIKLLAIKIVIFIKILMRVRNSHTLFFDYLGLMNKPYLLHLDGVKIKIRPKSIDRWVVIENLILDQYGISRFSNLRIETVVDIGANIGTFMLLACETFKHARVVAFEPNTANFELLIENIKLNGLSERVRAVNSAVTSSKESETILFLGRDGASHSTGATLSDKMEKVNNVCMEALSKEIIQPSLLKIDIEGGEYEIVCDKYVNILRQFDCIVLEGHNLHGDSSITWLDNFFHNQGIRFTRNNGLFTIYPCREP